MLNLTPSFSSQCTSSGAACVIPQTAFGSARPHAAFIVSETERHILGETSQWVGNTDPAVLPYWLVWKGAEWDIYFVPFYNGKDGNSAFVRGGNLCSYFYQYPPIARIAGNHQL